MIDNNPLAIKKITHNIKLKNNNNINKKQMKEKILIIKVNKK